MRLTVMHQIARRYLRVRHHFRFISLLTMLSFIGITLGVTALIVVVSIFNGFRELIQSHLLRFDPHIQISFAPAFPPDSLTVYQSQIQQLSEIQSIIPAVSGKILLATGERFRFIQLIGIAPDPLTEQRLDSALIAGKLRLLPFPTNTLLIGVNLANHLELLPNDSAIGITVSHFEQLLFAPSTLHQLPFTIQGIFRAQDKRYNAYTGFTHLSTALRLLPPSQRVIHLWIRCANLDVVPQVIEKLAVLLPSTVQIQSWHQLNQSLYNVMRFERMVAFGVIALVVLVAVFGAVVSLFMVVQIKKPEIAILKTLGASSSLIHRLFLTLSAYIGIGGSLLGTVLGSTLVLSQQHWGWIALDPQQYIVASLPVSLHITDLVVIAVSTMILTLLAGSIPARKAARLRTVHNLLCEEHLS